MSDEDTTAKDEDVEAHKMHRTEKTEQKTDSGNTEEPPDVEGHILGDEGRHDVGRHDHGKYES
jgi:hypothetical protein